MNLETIEMPVEEARQAFREYRHAIRSAKTAAVNSEDAQIARCYKALAEGRQVINIMEAFEQAGEDDRGLPRLAIARADCAKVAVQRRRWDEGQLEIGPAELLETERRWNANVEGRVFQFPCSILEKRMQEMYAIVPNIPPALRPPHSLQNYHLLWEPRWEHRPRPPGDPALLKHLGGPLYAVLATWDLTPVEQAVLGVTRN